MLYVLLTLVLSAALVEFVRVMPLRRMLGALRIVSARALRVMRSGRISEHWKEKALMGYARQMLFASSGLGAILLGVLALVHGAVRVGDAAIGGYGAFLFGPVGLILSFAAAVGWAWWRARG